MLSEETFLQGNYKPIAALLKELLKKSENKPEAIQSEPASIKNETSGASLSPAASTRDVMPPGRSPWCDATTRCDATKTWCNAKEGMYTGAPRPAKE